MQNTLYTYDRRIVNDIDVTDFTSVYYGKMLELFESYPDYFMTYEIEIDDKLENVSYRLYGSTDYADIILAANNDVFLWNMPYSSDITIEESNLLQKLLSSELKVTEDSSDELLDIFDSIDEGITLKNTRKRIMTVPKPDKINSLISIINRSREENRVPDITESTES